MERHSTTVNGADRSAAERIIACMLRFPDGRDYQTCASRDAFHAILVGLTRGEDRRDPMSKDGARLVLVVEDDVSVRRPLVKFLEMHGFAVVTAEKIGRAHV